MKSVPLHHQNNPKSTGPSSFLQHNLAKSLTHFVQEVMKGNRAAGARQLGIDRDAIGKWMQKTQRPLLESLVKVSFRLGTTLFGLLTGDVTSNITIEETSTILEKKVKRPYRKLNKVSLQDLLEAALEDTSVPPRPLTKIAQSLGYSPNQLRGYFPGLCQSVVTRYRIYVASRKEGRFRKELDALQQAICDLHEQGRYPSMKQVGKLLGKHGIFQNPEIRAIWQKTVREFGWGNKG